MTIQDLVVSSLVAFAVYLVSPNLLRAIPRRIVNSSIQQAIVQLVIFFIILAGTIFLVYDQLSNYRIIGMVLGLIALASLQHLGTVSTGWILPTDQLSTRLDRLRSTVRLNDLVLSRMLDLCEEKSFTVVRNIRTRVAFEGIVDEDLWSYLVEQSYEGTFTSGTRETVEVEVFPSVFPERPFQFSGQGPVPLNHSHPGVRSLVISPFLRRRDMNRWQSSLANRISVKVWLRSDQAVVREIVVRRATERRSYQLLNEIVELDSLRFNSETFLWGGPSENLVIRVEGLVQPIEFSSLYFLAEELCVGAWEFEAVLSPSAQDGEIIHISPVTVLGQVRVPRLSVDKNRAALRFEANDHSVILPQDAALVTLRVSERLNPLGPPLNMERSAEAKPR